MEHLKICKETILITCKLFILNNLFYTGIECRNADFRAFAFATHPDAYNPRKFKTLTCKDLITIGLTPSDEYKWEAQHKADTLWQVYFVGKELIKTGDYKPIAGHCLQEGAESIGDYIGRKLDEATEVLEDGFRKFINTVSRGEI